MRIAVRDDRWRHVLFAVGVIALVALAGCSTSTSGTPAGTATAESPAPATAETETPSPMGTVNYSVAPPGVNESGVDVATLAQSHFELLRNHSYTVAVTQQTSSSTRAQLQQRTVRVDNRTVGVTRDTSRAPATVEGWTDGTVTVQKYSLEDGNETRYQHNESRINVRRQSGQQFLVGALGMTNFTATGTTVRDGQPITRLRSTGPLRARASQRLFGSRLNVTRYTSRITATQDGAIVNMTVHAGLSAGGQALNVTWRYGVSDIDTTTVPRPDWTETARQQATQLNATLGGNRTYLAVTHEGGAAVPANAIMQWQTSPRSRPQRAQLQSAIEAGDTVYLSVRNDSLRLTTSPPETGQQFEMGLLVTFRTASGLPITRVVGVPERPPQRSLPTG
jgi:hypothetical protein